MRHTSTTCADARQDCPTCKGLGHVGQQYKSCPDCQAATGKKCIHLMGSLNPKWVRQNGEAVT